MNQTCDLICGCGDGPGKNEKWECVNCRMTSEMQRTDELRRQNGALLEALKAAIIPLEAAGVAFADIMAPDMKEAIRHARSLAVPALSAAPKQKPRPVQTEEILLRMTCCPCPEQYEAYYEGRKVGYLHLRHGEFNVWFPNINGEVVFSAEDMAGDGEFEPHERGKYLRIAREKIAEKLRAE